MLPFFEPGKTYHVYTHANGFENLFRCDRNYSYFLDKYTKYIYPVADTYSYCLMPNHLHLMVRIRNKEKVLQCLKIKNSSLQALESPGDFSLAISKQFSDLFDGYTQGLNKMYARKGSLFIPNYKRKRIEDADYFTNLLFYIHNNPVHHRFTNTMVDWAYSSYHSYTGIKEKLVHVDPVLTFLGGIEAFEKLHQKKNASKSFMKSLDEFML